MGRLTFSTRITLATERRDRYPMADHPARGRGEDTQKYVDESTALHVDNPLARQRVLVIRQPGRADAAPLLSLLSSP
jgi:hypothetical protein